MLGIANKPIAHVGETPAPDDFSERGQLDTDSRDASSFDDLGTFLASHNVAPDVSVLRIKAGVVECACFGWLPFARLSLKTDAE